MALNVTTAVFGEGCNTATASPSLVQWDKGQVLKIEGVDLPDAYQVEFSTVYTRNAIPRVGDASGVEVPNELLQRSAPITAYIVLHSTTDSRETEYFVTIHITPRTPPETTTPDPEQEDALDQAIAALEAGAAKAEAAAEAIQDMDVEAETLAAGSEASVDKTVDPETGAVTLNFGIPAGAQGSPGRPGQDGATPDFRIGTVTTLPPESPAEATITGTKEAPVLNLGIPQGEKGEPGGGSGTSDYTQLSNKPQINGHTLDGNKSASDLGLGTYSKPSGGIPKTDLAQGVQQSLNKADSALQTAPVQSVAGKTGAVNLGAGDVGFNSSEEYNEGTVGAKLGELSRQLSYVEEAVNDAAPVIINTASGDIASFADGADNRQIRKIVATIEPVQEGTGDPSPDNERLISGWTGANIFDASDASRLSAKNAKFDILPVQNGTGTPTPTNVRNINPGLSFTLDNGTVVDIYRGDITFHVDGTSTLISRYANRIFDGSELFTGWFNETQHIATSSSIRDASHEDGTSGYCNRYRIVYVGTNLTNVDTYSCAFGSTRSSHIFYVKDERYSTLEEFNAGCVGLQVVYPLYTPVVYELSVAETERAFAALGMQIKGLSIYWQSEAGTIYGGTVTLNEDGSVDILVTKAGKTISQLSGDPYISAGLLRWNSINDLFPGFIYSKNYNAPNAIATMLRGVGDTPIVATDAYRGTFAFGRAIFWISDNTCATAEAYREKYADCLIVWDLDSAQQQTIHIPSVGQLYTYHSANSVWIDTGAITECTYPADTKLYIEQLTKPTEDDMTADHAISAGTFFQLGNTLYLATAAIAAGATITPGTNATKLSLADALNQLNT